MNGKNSRDCNPPNLPSLHLVQIPPSTIGITSVLAQTLPPMPPTGIIDKIFVEIINMETNHNRTDAFTNGIDLGLCSGISTEPIYSFYLQGWVVLPA